MRAHEGGPARTRETVDGHGQTLLPGLIDTPATRLSIVLCYHISEAGGFGAEQERRGSDVAEYGKVDWSEHVLIDQHLNSQWPAYARRGP